MTGSCQYDMVTGAGWRCLLWLMGPMVTTIRNTTHAGNSGRLAPTVPSSATEVGLPLRPWCKHVLQVFTRTGVFAAAAVELHTYNGRLSGLGNYIPHSAVSIAGAHATDAKQR
jgi:hypothetical protein